MRRLQFPVEWEGGGERLLLSVHTGPSHTAQEFIADAFITRPVASFLDLLGQWKGMEGRFAVRAASRRVLVFDIAHDLVDAPWQVGSILGLIESAVFLQDLEDDPFITGVSVKGAAFAEATTEGCFADMDGFASLCAAGLSSLLGNDSTADGEPLGKWPARAERYMFEFRVPLGASLGSVGAARLRDVFVQAEVALAGSAFETERSAEDLIDERLIPFPVDIEISGADARLVWESPPSDIAIPVTLLRDIARRRLGVDTEWNVRVAEAW